MLARLVDLCDHRRRRGALGMRDFLQAAPERIFETDADLASQSTVNGVFDYWGFHGGPLEDRRFV